jgi:nucleotide-binding universal stress UspA family protein
MTNEILVPLDGSSLADTAIAHAAEIARRVDASLHLVRVHTPLNLAVLPTDAPIAIPDPVLDARLLTDEECWLEKRAESVSTLNDVAVTWEVRLGIPEAEVVLAAAERRSRLIVCTTRGTGGPARRWLGSAADSIMRHAGCPVLAMSPAAVARSVEIRKVLVLLDGSEASGSIVPHAAWLAHAFSAEIDYLRLTPPPHNPAQAILDHVSQTQPDAIALSTHGRGFTRLILGGIADELMRTAERPLLVYRPHDLAWDKPSGGRDLVVHMVH